ncbi:hypothetical protein BS47DRAFT_1384636 [Hydnum rufescens UP504]|uniref:Uncharacterized protein n=1 Tax=Hydnum rufescens UP504 TaxID=1448309 RepID=A0A9P6AMV9_9AGAM|nr:hypothetical protein BS47DRAFT_1384636 [Hydnum rufescens UP504]
MARDIPSSIVDASSIPPAMAARLAMAVVAHVLYVKEQIPFPVGQLASIPISNPKLATKRRDELLDALEKLDSQMSSTLQQLSWTLASRFKEGPAPPLESNSEPGISSSLPLTTRLHMMILIGSAISAPKARMVVELDRFEVRRFGWREDLIAQSLDEDKSQNDATLSLEVDRGCVSEELQDGDDRSSGKSTDVDSEEDDFGSECNDADRNSSAETASNSEDGMGPPSDASDVSEDEEQSIDHVYLSPQSSSTSPSTSPAPAPRPPSASQMHRNVPEQPSMESQIRAAEKALYRTLASSISMDELPPTNIHILLRAPRCFKSPPAPKSTDVRANPRALTMWEPIQMYTGILEEMLWDYFDPARVQEKKKSSISRVKTEGVRVECRGCDVVESEWDGPDVKRNSESVDESEGDEMIWWQWSGRLKGIGSDLFL